MATFKTFLRGVASAAKEVLTIAVGTAIGTKVALGGKDPVINPDNLNELASKAKKALGDIDRAIGESGFGKKIHDWAERQRTLRSRR